jgi:hypothetical protein
MGKTHPGASAPRISTAPSKMQARTSANQLGTANTFGYTN